ncbi:MAG: sugar ABC transporter permease [Lachnospiraceae bacterium]|nr:sugar ABC transporter permease [Lachnospiraceae bacterium]
MRGRKQNVQELSTIRKKNISSILAAEWKRNWILYIMTLPALLYFLVYCYFPMFGLVIAFQDYRVGDSFLGGEFVGFKHFLDFFDSYYFGRLIKNTLLISLGVLIFGYPVPLIFALLLNEVRNVGFKKLAQTVTYLPHFISLVVICGLVLDFTKMDGLINTIIEFFGGEKIPFMSRPEWFQPVYIISDIWASFGWNSIVFMSALLGIDSEQYEAAALDGANRLQKMIYISIPGILPVIITTLLMRLGRVMSLGFEKVFNLYNTSTYETADIISTFVYRQGILNANYSSATAIGLFNAIINLVLVMGANKLSKKLTDSCLW